MVSHLPSVAGFGDCDNEKHYHTKRVYLVGLLIIVCVSLAKYKRRRKRFFHAWKMYEKQRAEVLRSR